MQGSRASVLMLGLAFAASGFGSLGTQSVLSRWLAQDLGHEVPAVIGLISAVMAGLAAGALWWKKGRIHSCPYRALSVLETWIGLAAVAGILWIPLVAKVANSWAGSAALSTPEGVLQAALICLGLFPLTFPMGATLPAMEQIAVQSYRDSRVMGWVTGINTGGAAMGCLAGAWIILPSLGLVGSLVAFGVLNLLAAACLFSRSTSRGLNEEFAIPNRPGNSEGRTRILITLFLTGLIGLAYEVLGLRFLSLALDNTAYTFATALAVYLIGSSMGGFVHFAWIRSKHPWDALAWLTGTAALTLVLSVLLFTRVAGASGERPGHWQEWVLPVLVFVLPSLVMGAVFAHLVCLARNAGLRVSHAAAVNFAGGALGALLMGVILIPAAGFKIAWTSCVAGYLCLTPHLRSWTWRVSVLLFFLLIPMELRLTEPPPGWRVLDFLPGRIASAEVLINDAGERTLRMNHRLQMGGTSATVPQRRQAHLPLLLHPDPRHVLFLGPGTGITLGAAIKHQGLRADAVEISPEAVSMMRHFEPENRAAYRLPDVRLHVADARRYARVSTNRYDVIVADLFHPWQDGSGSLYTVEHFQAVRSRLTKDGLFCQWLPMHQLDLQSWQMIARSFLKVFSETELWILHFNTDIPVVG
ncbi:MAG: hypothetical protein FJ405_02170, partial [Verrucomicrobia bacterium]|nr:hypothetical protein [Verrucomicrobiota bacterium]